MHEVFCNDFGAFPSTIDCIETWKPHDPVANVLNLGKFHNLMEFVGSYEGFKTSYIAMSELLYVQKVGLWDSILRYTVVLLVQQLFLF